jgi:hypothetical protein
VREPKTAKTDGTLICTPVRTTATARSPGSGNLGATVLQEIEEPGTEHVVIADPEGKEFCVQ